MPGCITEDASVIIPNGIRDGHGMFFCVRPDVFDPITFGLTMRASPKGAERKRKSNGIGAAEAIDETGKAVFGFKHAFLHTANPPSVVVDGSGLSVQSLAFGSVMCFPSQVG